MGRTWTGRTPSHHKTDHPHARGENAVIPLGFIGASRTIPTHVGRTWRDLPESCFVRTIPTHVGRTGAPRSGFQSQAGPSPRTWGEQRFDTTRAANRPDHPHARGENVSMFDDACRRDPDHPHARGENSAKTGGCSCDFGPSPRTWGEPDTCRRTASHDADHPHARGENRHVELYQTAIHGPSPRTWGERSRSRTCYVVSRTIPTHVGRTDVNSLAAISQYGPSPRTWGERRPDMIRVFALSDGPSPRTWGEPRSARARWRSRTADHPHARGENAVRAVTDRRSRGPSPRTWGERTSQPCQVNSQESDHPHARGENPEFQTS